MNESREDYLETLFVLNQKYPNSVRSVDVAKMLGYTKSSVSRAMTILKEEGYVTCDERGYLVLTNLGKDLAENIYEKHQILSTYLQKCVKVDKETAEADACRMEHIMSEITYQKIKELVLQV